MKIEQGDRLFWIWLSRRLGEGSRIYPELLERFISPYDIYKADEEELLSIMPNMSERVCRALCDKRLDEAYDIMGYCQRGGCSLLCYGDANYPLSLRSLEDPPLVLYYRGRLPDFQNELFIAMVGTRKMSEYGKRTSYKIAYELARAGAVIVSGMARGIDGVAAAAALEAGGKTVAFLGCGIDVAYPPEHTEFKRIIEQRGVVMTEYAPGARPERYHFPVRNRLISGLSQGTVIIDAREGSGSLITAERALTQGRALYAVPANVGGPNAAGANNLIRDGARVVLCADDILKDHSLLYRHIIQTDKSAALGTVSDYDESVLTRMGVYTQTVDGGEQTGKTPSSARVARAEKNGARNQQRIKQAVHPLPSESATPSPQHKPCPPDASIHALESLGERERRVFEHIPMDTPIGIDGLQTLGYSTGELLAALSMLEIQGLIQTLPGGLYARA